MAKERSHPTSWKILLVEDDLDFASLLRIRLANETAPRLIITTIPTLKQALAALKKDTYHLILLDLMLPDSAGIETFEKIKAETRHTPIVIMSGIDDDRIAITAVQKGAEDYLIKNDISSKFVLRIIHHAIDRHRIKEKLASVTGRLRKTNLQLEKMALVDPLTELYNRRGLQQVFTQEINFAAPGPYCLFALLLDIDGFKKIADTLGYPVADILLKETSQKIKESVRPTDHIARIGGDEFVLLLPKTNFQEAVHVAEKLRMAISDTVVSVSETESLRVTTSMGLTPIFGNITSVDELLALADPLLRRSKQRGKNRVSYNAADPGQALSPDASFSEQFTAVLRRGTDFFALKQPIMNLYDLSVTGYEFLSRLKGDGICMPNDFFKIALEQNMLPLVDRYCFRSCINASAVIASDLRRHINLFPTTIIDITPEELLRGLGNNCPPASYCFELSEQQILGDASNLAGAVETFKHFGVSIAIDDVGFGNTCLESLILLEPDVIKLDKKYIRGISDHPQIEKTLRRVLKIAEDLSAEVIAEGIESKEDLDLLKELGVKYGQGFYLGIPA